MTRNPRKPAIKVCCSCFLILFILVICPLCYLFSINGFWLAIFNSSNWIQFTDLQKVSSHLTNTTIPLTDKYSLVVNPIDENKQTVSLINISTHTGGFVGELTKMDSIGYAVIKSPRRQLLILQEPVGGSMGGQYITAFDITRAPAEVITSRTYTCPNPVLIGNSVWISQTDTNCEDLAGLIKLWLTYQTIPLR